MLSRASSHMLHQSFKSTITKKKTGSSQTTSGNIFGIVPKAQDSSSRFSEGDFHNVDEHEDNMPYGNIFAMYN